MYLLFDALKRSDTLNPQKKIFNNEIHGFSRIENVFYKKHMKNAHFTNLWTQLPLPTLTKAIVRKPCDQENKISA